MNTQWLLAAVVCSALLLRKYALPAITRHFFFDLPVHKQVKISNYMLELAGTSLAIVGTSAAGFWQVLFSPSMYEPHPSPEQPYNLAFGFQCLASSILPVYVMELASDESMRLELALHHWISLLCLLWAMLVAYEVGNDAFMARTFFSFSLYMSTEQNVFIEMLAYHRKIYWPTLYRLSAYYYGLSRLAITIISMWTWCDSYALVFQDGLHNSAAVYGLRLFIPLANVILNVTQWSTLTSLFGIAAAVRKKSAELQQQREVVMRMVSLKSETGAIESTEIQSAESELLNIRVRSQLGDIFARIDADDKGSITLRPWTGYIKSLDLQIVVPHWVIKQLFFSMGCDDEKVDFEAFHAAFSAMVTPSLKFSLVLTGALLKVMLQGEVDDATRRLAMERYTNLLEFIKQLNASSSLGPAWAVVPRSKSTPSRCGRSNTCGTLAPQSTPSEPSEASSLHLILEKTGVHVDCDSG